jgi:hypothetical protein
MLIGFASLVCLRWLSAVRVDVLARWWSVGSPGAGRWGRCGVFQPIDQHLEAGGEPLVAVVDPDVLAEGDQGGEAVGGQRAEELVQLGSDGVVADALFVDRGGRSC